MDDNSTFPVVFFLLLFLWRSGGAFEITNKRGQEARGGWQQSWEQVAEVGVVLGWEGPVTQGGAGRGKRAGARVAGAAHSPKGPPAGDSLGGKAADF